MIGILYFGFKVGLNWIQQNIHMDRVFILVLIKIIKIKVFILRFKIQGFINEQPN